MQLNWRRHYVPRTLACLLVCMALLGGQLSVLAQDPGGFSIRAVLPENQIDPKQTYFDLRMAPGAKQRLQVVITNSRAEPLVAQVQLNSASTGKNGSVIYTNSAARTHTGLTIADVASLSTQEVIVPAHSSQTVEIYLSMPDTLPEGLVLGGIAVTERPAEEDPTPEEGVSIRNVITYVIALRLALSEVMPNPDFSLRSITPSVINYRTAVSVTLRNHAARLIHGMAVYAEIFRRGDSTALHTLALDEAGMAPMTDGDFIIDWEGQPLTPGSYRLHMTADYQGRRWQWDEDFIITAKDSSLNDEALNLAPAKGFLSWPLFFAFLVCLCVFAYWLGTRRRKQERT